MGITLAFLDAPGQIWPWFAMGWAYMAALLCLYLIRSWAPAAFLGLLGAVPLAYAGFALFDLGYGVLAWASWGVAGVLVVSVAVTSLKAALKRAPKGD